VRQHKFGIRARATPLRLQTPIEIRANSESGVGLHIRLRESAGTNLLMPSTSPSGSWHSPACVACC
jgi:hypothetical protein